MILAYSSKYVFNTGTRGCFVYYEVFIDVLFIKNCVMDFFLLRLVNRLLRGSATLRRSLLGACIGAAGLCLLAIFPGSRLLNTILVHVVVNTMMVRFGCNIKKIRNLVKGVLLVYAASILLGGAQQLIQRYTLFQGVRIFVLSGTISYLLLAAGIRAYARAEKKADRIFKVRLYANGKCKEGTALLDTGNSLMDPISGKPVCIAEMAVLEAILPANINERLMEFGEGKICGNDFGNLKPHFIPFTSLGCSKGIVLAVTLDSMCLEGVKIHKEIIHPVIAFSRENSSFHGDYQVILHPNLINS
ncbi:MAG: hypothetical protein EOM18_03465 [Clostridia bacterium]|nr:hypothetical protein [Clostridia bacterium]